MPIQPLPTDTKSYSWYQDISKLPLRNFEECFINNNLSALIISGFPTPQELHAAWENIMQEYSDSLGESEYNMYLNLWKEVELLRIDYESIRLLIMALRKVYSKYFCDELNSLLFTSCKFDINDIPSYLSELDNCERRSGAKKIQLDLKKIEFEEIKKKVNGEKGQSIDKNYFTGVLIILSKHNNYRITKDIFVNEYCEYLKQFNFYYDQVYKVRSKK